MAFQLANAYCHYMCATYRCTDTSVVPCPGQTSGQWLFDTEC